MAKKATKIEVEYRTQRIARMMAQGATRSDVQQYAAAEWGLSVRVIDKYIARAREAIKADWSQERDTFVATLLSQLNHVHKKGLETNQLNAVLGAINTAAKLTQLIDGK